MKSKSIVKSARSNWEAVPVSVAMSLIKDGSHGSHSEVINGIPLLSAKDIRDGRVVIDNSPRLISSADFNQIHKGYSIKNDDILLTLVGSIGRVGLVKDYHNDYTLQRSVGVLRPANGSSLFFFHLFQGSDFQRQLVKKENKGAQGGVYLGSLGKILIKVPDLAEQGRIVAVLETWDKAIDVLVKKIELKKQVKKGLMQSLLTGKLRLPGFTDEWEIRKLSDLCDIGTGKKNNQDKIKGGSYPFFVRSPHIERINSYSYDGEAILIPGEGNIGKIFHYINGKFDFHQRVYKVSEFKTGVLGKYIYYYLVKNFSKATKSDSVKATVDSLRLPTFTNFKVVIPSCKEQASIVGLLDTVENELEKLETKLKILQEQKRYLLNNLIAGTIRTPETL